MPSIAQITAANATASLIGKRAMVVGGTSGIGKGIALRLARAGASVTIVGRNEEVGRQIVTEMSNTQLNKNDNPIPSFEFIRCNAEILSNIKSFADTLIQGSNNLDILVLSQGIASIDGYTPTTEGIERKLAIHYYGRVAFMKCLLPLMVNSPTPQIMTILSAGVHSPYQLYESDPDLKENFSIKNAADAAGFYNDIAVEMMSHEHPRATFIHTAPGIIKTNWGSEFPWFIRYPLRLIQCTFRSPEDCAEAHLYGLLLPESTAGGFLLLSPEAERARVTPLHDTAKDFIWRHTKEVLSRFGIV